MKSIGTVKVSGEEYILMIVYQKSVTYYYLLNKYHRDDQKSLVFGGEIEHAVRGEMSYAAAPVDNNYMMAAIKRKNLGGSMQSWGTWQILLRILNAIQTATTYSFRPKDIRLDLNDKYSEKAEPIRQFMAQDDNLLIEYRKIGGFIGELKYESDEMSIVMRLEPDYRYPNIKEVTPLLTDLEVEDAGTRVFYSNVKTVDYEAVIRNMKDPTWWVTTDEDGNEVYRKDYRDVETKEAFERDIIMGLVNELKEARRTGTLPLLISVDTETTGLDVFNVPLQYQSQVVAIPLSFKDDQGFVIYTGMEYFDNVPLEYIRERLSPFVARDLSADPDITINTLEGPFIFKRSEIFNTGHNTMFDIRAFSTAGIPIWYDADTLQMSFNLDPFLTKRRNSLKLITRKAFGCETPELADVLGEGNEDKYRYIGDRRVARLYGGADGDFGRLVFKYIRNIYRECETFHRKDLFQAYLDQDVVMMNFVASFDYDGIRVDRERFIKAGQQVERDMEIITNFTHKYVGRVIVANNYLRQRRMIEDANLEIDSNISLLTSPYEGQELPPQVAALVSEMNGRKLDPSSIPSPDLANAPPHIFKFAGNDLIKTLYETLNYPVLVRTEPPRSTEAVDKVVKSRPAVNKTAMKKLMEKQNTEGSGLLKKDIMTIDAQGREVPLISAKEFNSFKYPVAYLVSLIGPRKKEYDSYFKAFLQDSFGERLCKDSRFASIDTRRISNPLQTIKGSLKEFMLPYDDTYAMCDFDMSQVELRIMASLAQDVITTERMKNPEVDSHTECASSMSVGMKDPKTGALGWDGKKDPKTGNIIPKPAYLIGKWERSNAKQINFGYPYGLGAYSMCERIFGKITHENLAATHRIIEAFEKARKEVVDFLNRVREHTVTPVGTFAEEPIPIPPILRKYLEIGDSVPVGIVRNLKGFYKLFQLDDMTDKKRARIKRQSGNYPVQSFAAELFRVILIRLFKEFWDLGWIQNKWVRGHLLIHDEFLFSFKKKHIHPVHLASIIHKCCSVTISGHTKYFIGINFGNTFGDCKNDSLELPVRCVERLQARWLSGEFEGEQVDDPRTYMLKHRSEYITQRITEVVKSIAPTTSKEEVNCGKILANFENYTVRKYVYENFKPLWTPKKDVNGNVSDADLFDTYLASWALTEFGEGTQLITSDKKKVILHSDLKKMTRLANGKIVPYTFGEMFEGVVLDAGDFLSVTDLLDGLGIESSDDEDYYKEIDWNLDGSGSDYTVEYGSSGDEDESFEDHFDAEIAGTMEMMRKIKPTSFDNMRIGGTRITIDAHRKNHVQLIEGMIKSEGLAADDGMQIYYLYNKSPLKGSKVAKAELATLDAIIAKIRSCSNGVQKERRR